MNPNLSESDKKTSYVFDNFAKQLDSDGSLKSKLFMLTSGVSIFVGFIQAFQITIIFMILNTILPLNFYSVLRLFCAMVVHKTSDWTQDA